MVVVDTLHANAGFLDGFLMFCDRLVVAVAAGVAAELFRGCAGR